MSHVVFVLCLSIARLMKIIDSQFILSEAKFALLSVVCFFHVSILCAKYKILQYYDTQSLFRLIFWNSLRLIVIRITEIWWNPRWKYIKVWDCSIIDYRSSFMLPRPIIVIHMNSGWISIRKKISKISINRTML